MTDRQLRHLDAAISQDKAITKFITIWGTDAPLMLRQTRLQNAIKKVNDKVLAQKRNLGYRAETLHDLQTLEGRAWAIAKITHEYAVDINDNELAGKVAYDLSDFNHGSMVQIKTNAKAVYDTVNGAVQTAMTTAGYHITPADVTALGDIIEEVEDDMGMPKADIAASKAATEALKHAIADDLDPAMDSVVDYLTPYALTNLDEYNTVVDASEIAEIGLRHIALRIRVSDDTTHTRCGQALANIDGPGIEEGKKVEKKTSKRGISDYAHEALPEGNYTVTITHKGYQPKVINNVAVYNDKMTLLDVQLTRTV